MCMLCITLLMITIYKKKALFVKKESGNIVSHDIQVLYPTKQTDEKWKEFYCKKQKLVLSVFIVIIAISMVIEIEEIIQPTLKEGLYIRRSDYGESADSIKVRAYYNDNMDYKELYANIDSRKYRIDQIEKMVEKLSKYLSQVIKGNNTSLDEVRSDLKLPNKVEGYPFKIEWEINNYSVIDSSGKIKSDKTIEEGTEIQLKAIMSYEEYSAESLWHIKVYPPYVTTEKNFTEILKKAISNSNTHNSTDEIMSLPTQVEGKSITWKEQTEHKSLYLFIIGIILAFGIYYNEDQKLHNKIKARNEEMLLDYAEIINKVILYLGAGMTVKAAWSKIALEYREKREITKTRKYAYEEILITYYEMKEGISEIIAYERFGKRADNMQYQVFSSIIIQCVKRGIQSSRESLIYEMNNAFEERKRIAKRLGEEAGTKLLIPMFIMLLIVVIIIILPAFLSLQVVS